MAVNMVNSVIITNNVLYFLNKNIHCAAPDSIIKCCRDHFKDTDIALAKTVLLKHSKGHLVSIDTDLAKRASKRKRVSKYRSTEAVNLRDMLDVLDALSSHGINLNIHYANVDFIPNMNPESVTIPAIATRISIAENDLQLLTITTEASIDQLSGEYNNLKKDTQITIQANQMLNKQNELLLNDNKSLEGDIITLKHDVNGLKDQNKQLTCKVDLLTVKLSTLLSLPSSVSHPNYLKSNNTFQPTSNPLTKAILPIPSIGPSTFLFSNSSSTDNSFPSNIHSIYPSILSSNPSLIAPNLPSTTIPSLDPPLPIISPPSSTSHLSPSLLLFSTPPFDISTPYTSLPMHASATSHTCTPLNKSLSIKIPSTNFTKPLSQSPQVNNSKITHKQCHISPTPSNTPAPPSPSPSTLSPPSPTPSSPAPSSPTSSSPAPLPPTHLSPAPLSPIPCNTNTLEQYLTNIPPPPLTSYLTLPTDDISNFSSLPPPAAFITLADISPPTIDSQNSIKTYNSHPNTSKPSPSVQINPSSSSSNDDDQSHAEPIGTHKRNIFATNAATAAAIVAIKTGSTELQAMLVGSDAAKKAMASFSKVKADKTKKGKAKNNDVVILQNSNHSGSMPNVNAPSTMSFNSTASSGIQHNTPAPDAVRKKVKFVRGTASDSNRSLAGELPDHFKNKVMVISPVSKDLSRVQLKEEIDRIAGRNINYLYEPVILNKVFQKTRTIAIELTDEDYRLLSNRNIWNPNMMISEFEGNRFWRRNSMRLTPTERKNSVKDSWHQ